MAVLALALMFIAACTPRPPQPVKLETPVISRNGNLVEWEAVENADGYIIFLNDAEKERVSSASYLFAETVVGTYSLKVAAVSDNDLYLDSDASNEIIFEVSQPELVVDVTKSPYFAVGDDFTNDRAAIQKAIDDVYDAGGGTVLLAANKTFLTGNLILRDNVTLYFDEGSSLHQTSVKSAYVRYDAEEKEYYPWEPVYKHDIDASVEFNHAWYTNLPFLYAPEGTSNVKIVGSGTIRMMGERDCNKVMHLVPIGCFKTRNILISGVTITDYNSYAVFLTHCNDVLIKDVTIKDFCCGNCDGISLQNCQDVRVTGCSISSGDDSLYIWSSYADPRGGTWWTDMDPQPSKNFEFDNNSCNAGEECKAFGMILWGLTCDDLSKVTISNVNIHDNYFHTMGIWVYYPPSYAEVSGDLPICNVRWSNNEIDRIQSGFDGVKIADQNYFDSVKELMNGDFEYAGDGFWTVKPNSSENSAGVRYEELNGKKNCYGYIDNLDKGDAKLYQGLHFTKGRSYRFSANVKTNGAACRIFVRNLDTQELVAQKEFSNTESERVSLEFLIPETGNYHVGIERGNATDGWATIDDAVLETLYGQEVIFLDQTPEEFKNDARLELGTVFRTKAAGRIVKVRIFTSAAESGIHTVRIWDKATGKTVAGPYEWNISAGVEGWREFVLPQQPHLIPDCEYTLSVSAGEDKIYAYSQNGLASAIDNEYLTVSAQGGVVGTELGAMPATASNANYFRDVVFETDEQNIFTSQIPSFFLPDSRPLEAGTVFAADTDGYVNKVRIYADAAECGVHAVRIWDYASQTMLAGPYDWDIEAGTKGWHTFTLPKPVYIKAGDKYVVSVSTGADCIVPHGERDSGFGTPVTNGNLSTFAGSGVYSYTLGAMPSSTFNDTNYFRDVCFVPFGNDRYSDTVYAEIIGALISDLAEYKDAPVTAFNVKEIRGIYSRAAYAMEHASQSVLALVSDEDKATVESVGAALEAYENGAGELLGIVYESPFGETVIVSDGGESAYIGGVNYMPSADGKLSAEDIIKVAYYISLNEISDLNGYLTFDPIIMRNEGGNWTTTYGASVRVNYADLAAQSGKVILCFTMRLPEGYDGTLDAICPRVQFHSGIKATLDTIAIAGEECDFSQLAGFTVGADTKIPSGEMSPDYVKPTEPVDPPQQPEGAEIFWEGATGANCAGLVGGLNHMPSADNKVKAGDIVKLAYYMSVTAIADESGYAVFCPIIMRNENGGWITYAKASQRVEYSVFAAKNGYAILSFIMKMPENFDGTIDAICPRIEFSEGISASLTKILTANEKYDFSKVGGYELAVEQKIESGELSPDYVKPIDPVDPPEQSEVYWQADSSASCVGMVQGLNCMPSADGRLVGGMTVKVAFYLTVTELSEEGYAEFNPLMQRSTDGWATVGEGAQRMSFSQFSVKEGTVIISFVMRLPDGFDGTTDAICPRITFSEGITATLNKIIITDCNYDFTQVGVYTLACELKIAEGELSPDYKLPEEPSLPVNPPEQGGEAEGI